MQVKNILPRPVQHLNEATKKYPGAWKSLQYIRKGKGIDLPDWPDWCLTPMAAHAAIVSTQYNRLSLNFSCEISMLAALDAWRYTQGIYKFTDTLYESIRNTKISRNIPADVLFRLPQWCVYIETPSDKNQFGFFAHLEHDIATGRAEIRFLLDQENGLVPLILHLGDWSVEESIERTWSESNKQRALCFSETDEINDLYNDDLIVRNAKKLMCQVAHQCISLLLYLCSDEPDIEQIEKFPPNNPTLRNTKKGLRFFPPKKSTIWNVGKDLAKSLNVDTDFKGGKNKNMTPHIRSAHWHGFWSGKRNSNSRKFNFKWLPPLIINANSLAGEFQDAA
ncbi:AcrVA2 family anti-CRISPR protein [Shewanella polaris]|uniref:Uncharacterized protein n=1 Tax=Shewanella polaris TaxID=2588449 RepID=A0A4Y5YGQ9_9GAMM|nr:hypothetical protein [Shewanella polaris]QDE31990.1 hypothetical protein FH971_14090 [Shewanella polaris]